MLELGKLVFEPTCSGWSLTQQQRLPSRPTPVQQVEVELAPPPSGQHLSPGKPEARPGSSDPGPQRPVGNLGSASW